MSELHYFLNQTKATKITTHLRKTLQSGVAQFMLKISELTEWSKIIHAAKIHVFSQVDFLN